jgi:predicted small lipoprotein YifL
VTRTLLAAFAVLTVALTLSACGKKGFPTPPGPPDQVIWPRGYPSR